MDLRQKNKLDTVTLMELMGNDFFIPDYQRGYRWTETEVTKLMEDLDEYVCKFDDDTHPSRDFYCMQPLVVFFNKQKNYWEVIDGQQRLTTTYLILNQDRENLQKQPFCQIFTLDYQSRPGSKAYLETIDPDKRDENIDFYHIYNANETIKNYFAAAYLSPSEFIREILNVHNRKNRPVVKFIWYDVTEEIESGQISPEEKFSALNIGKIGLTNAELIKSLFLHHVSSNESEALRIATEWDLIEHALQEDKFWNFIYGKDDDKYATRIEFLFDIIRKKNSANQDAYYTFNQYINIIKARSQKALAQDVVKELWKEVSDKYHLFKGWYEDNDLYHIIGYLRYIKKPISEIESVYYDPDNKNMPAVYAALKKEALNSLENPDIRNLDYNENPGKIFNTLLLFNILSLVDCQKENIRFSFSDFYSHSWDIEHVRSQTPKKLKNAERIDWLVCNLEYFSGVDYNATELDENKNVVSKYHDHFDRYVKDIAASAYLDSNINGHTAGELCRELLKLWESGEEIEDSLIYRVLSEELFLQDDTFPYTHSIGNLVLLDQGTNRGYKNAFFPVKRKWVYRRENEGIYILPCTRNVFAKNYSTMIFDQMNWNEHDAVAYMNEIERTLEDGYDREK